MSADSVGIAYVRASTTTGFIDLCIMKNGEHTFVPIKADMAVRLSARMLTEALAAKRAEENKAAGAQVVLSAPEQ